MSKRYKQLCNQCLNPGEIIKHYYEDLVIARDFKEYSPESNLEDSKYTNCKFEEVDLHQVKFSNVIFQWCTFIECNFTECRVDSMSFLEFNDCSINNTSIINCEFSSLYIRGCELVNVEFKDSFMKGCNLIKNSYSEVKFIDDCNLMDCIIKDTCDLMDIRFINERSYTKLNYGSYIGKFNYEKNLNCNRCSEDKSSCSCKYRLQSLNVSFSYMDFGEQYLRNHIGGKFGKCFYESKLAFHRTLKGKKKLKSYLSNIVCGYGEKPYRSFIISLMVILVFALLYMITGIETPRGVISIFTVIDNFSMYDLVSNIIYCIHFSLVTFSTVGYGNLLPCGLSGIILSSIEILMGIIMIGIWTSTLVRKMTR
ncbi:pentapeptide repeat-containing protein [Clostridium sp.]|uniref:pentapeptide repeat-containing protein n=1 Tax=Clostridium sp. TaxID=1506 RepID=UPI0032173892